MLRSDHKAPVIILKGGLNPDQDGTDGQGKQVPRSTLALFGGLAQADSLDHPFCRTRGSDVPRKTPAGPVAVRPLSPGGTKLPPSGGEASLPGAGSCESSPGVSLVDCIRCRRQEEPDRPLTPHTLRSLFEQPLETCRCPPVGSCGSCLAMRWTKPRARWMRLMPLRRSIILTWNLRASLSHWPLKRSRKPRSRPGFLIRLHDRNLCRFSTNCEWYPVSVSQWSHRCTICKTIHGPPPRRDLKAASDPLLRPSATTADRPCRRRRPADVRWPARPMA